MNRYRKFPATATLLGAVAVLRAAVAQEPAPAPAVPADAAVPAVTNAVSPAAPAAATNAPAIDLHAPVPLAGPEAPPAPARPPEAPPPAPPRAANPLEGRVAIGTRSTTYTLDTKSEPNYDAARRSYFIGSIDELGEVQDKSPTKFFIEARPIPHVGVELSREEVRAHTTTAVDGHSDGDFLVSGPTLSLVARWPNEYRVTPYAGVGLGFFQGDFDADAWWGLGYASEADWIALGRPRTPRNDRTRVMDTDDPTAELYFLGVDIQLYGNWSLDLFWRHMAVDLAAEFYVAQRGAALTSPIAGTIPLSNDAWGIGARYHF
jgi:opacity protein-like surface antigen